VAQNAIIGLGNPGDCYQNTRHNIGFWLVDELAKSKGLTFHSKSKLNAETATLVMQEKSYLLVKPMTYMNESGRYLKSLLSYSNCTAKSAILIHDDITLPVGGLKISISRGAGGHNGVQSVMNALGNSLVRLRLGVGPNPNPFDSLAKYVLSAFNSEESNKLNDRKDYFMNALFKIVDDGVDSAMNLLNQNLNTNTPK
jgi:PTH1 family peptidyl-tRNA hydrolase